MSFLPKKKELTWSWLGRKLAWNFPTLGVILAIVAALVYPEPGEEVSEWTIGSFRGVQTINICTIFFISGLTLNTDDFELAVRSFRSLAYGFIAILVITPALGFGIVQIPFGPSEFARGLTIFATVPTTFTSGVALVRQARGHASLALLLTACSTLLGIVTVPFAIELIISSAGNVDIDALKLLLKLVCTVLVPLIVGKALREVFSFLQKLVMAYEMLLSLIGSLSLILIVWQTLSRSKEVVVDQKVTDILILVAGGIGMHLIYLLWNYSATAALQVPQQDKRAVVIMASQKALPVSLTVILFLDELAVGNHGLLAIPCIVGHMAQLFIDTGIASIWAECTNGNEAVEPKDVDLEALTIDEPSKAQAEKGKDSKLPVKMVDNPLAVDFPEQESSPFKCILNTENKKAGYGKGFRHAAPERLSVELSSSSNESFVSAHTAGSNSTFRSAHDTPRSVDGH